MGRTECKYGDSCGYDLCVPEFCKEYEPKPMTNADRIRAMSDEELVNVVPCPLGFSMFRCPKERQCGPCKRDWLQQPYGGADHE